MAAFLTKLFEFGRLEFEIFIEVWFWLYGVALMGNSTYYKTPNVKRDVTKRYSNSNGKQEANNKEFKVFCGSCDLEITSRNNDMPGNNDFCVMILKV